MRLIRGTQKVLRSGQPWDGKQSEYWLDLADAWDSMNDALDVFESDKKQLLIDATKLIFDAKEE